MSQAGHSVRRDAAFTLIEMLAVVAILALVMTFAIPNAGALRQRRLETQSKQLVAQIELARQRAVMTGIPHRLWIDLDEAAYRMDWYVSEAKASNLPRAAAPEYDLRGNTPLPLAAPAPPERMYRPVPGSGGMDRFLADEFHFAGLETDAGWIARGEVEVVFDRDGTSVYSEILLESDAGDRLVLEIQPLADAVQVRHEGV